MEHELIISLIAAASSMIAIAASIIFVEERHRRERKRCIGTLTYIDGQIYFGMKSCDIHIFESLNDGDIISLIVRRK